MSEPEKFDWDMSDHSGFSYSGTLARLGRLRSGRGDGDGDPPSHPGRVAALVIVVVLISIVCMVIGIRS